MQRLSTDIKVFAVIHAQSPIFYVRRTEWVHTLKEDGTPVGSTEYLLMFAKIGAGDVSECKIKAADLPESLVLNPAHEFDVADEDNAVMFALAS